MRKLIPYKRPLTHLAYVAAGVLLAVTIEGPIRRGIDRIPIEGKFGWGPEFVLFGIALVCGLVIHGLRTWKEDR